MTRNDIMRMAREAKLPDPMVFYASIERFAALVAAHEREACAKECENHKVGLDSYFEIDERIQECAEAIRAMGGHDSATRHP